MPAVLLAGDHPDPSLWNDGPLVSSEPPADVLPTAEPPSQTAHPAEESTPAAEVPIHSIVAEPQAFPAPIPLWMRPRDPFCLVIFWQPDPAALQTFAARQSGGSWRLRLLGGDTGQQVLTDEALPLEADHRFVPVPAAGRRYVAEIGFWEPDGFWRLLTRSAPVTTPVAGPTATWTPPAPVAPAAGAPARPASGRSRRHSQNQAAGPVPTVVAATLPLERDRDLPDSPDVLWALVWEPAHPAPSLSSADLTQWISRLIPSTRQASGPAVSGSSEAGIQPPDSPSSGEFTGAPARTFWFEVNAELILYGRTERDARVTIGNRPIALRSDGSFRFQFTLPDGTYDLPVVAINAAGDDGRSARLEFSRITTLAGEVGVHPQDPALRPPAVESVG